MNYDDERANRIFTMFCYIALIAFFIGGIAGTLITCFLFKYFG